MILFVCVKLNEIHDQGRKFNWIKPHSCPRCGSAHLWGHGFVMAHFDGFAQGLFLRRFRCPDCACIIRLRPQGFFRRFQTSVDVIRACLKLRLSSGKWLFGPSHQRQRHWLSALKRKSLAFFGKGPKFTTTDSLFNRFIDFGRCDRLERIYSSNWRLIGWTSWIQNVRSA